MRGRCEERQVKRDVQATAAKQYLDPRSYTAKDGRELLLGIGNADWIKRKKELWERAGGTCEYWFAEAGVKTVSSKPSSRFKVRRCWKEGTIPAHIIPRKDITQRDDRMSNLKLYCEEHDKLMEKQSWRKPRFGEKVSSHP